MEMKFYKCEHCGQIIAMVKGRGVPVMCCGEKMKEIIPCSTEAATEKHVPVIGYENGKVVVTVGSVAHPMTAEHYIEWILLVTKNGNQRIALTPNDEPKAEFALIDGDEVIAAYAYCNLHSLWRT